MNRRLRILALAALGALPAATLPADSMDEVAARATTEYTVKLQQASEQLTRAREQIAAEKAPLLDALQAAENRIVAAQAEITRLQTGQENGDDRRHGLAKEYEGLRKNILYMSSLAHDSLTGLRDSLAPGQTPEWGPQVDALQRRFDGATPTTEPTDDALNLLLDKVRRGLGGYTAPGSAVMADTNELATGTFAFVGPQTFFLPDSGRGAGTVREREGVDQPVNYPLSGWDPAQASAFFHGGLGSIMADVSGGKALRLQETRGTLWQHVQKGGVVSYAIVCVGAISVLLILFKSIDLWQLGLDRPSTVHRFLSAVAGGAPQAELEKAVGKLRTATRELFVIGVAGIEEPKERLEERMWAVLLRQRLHFERRLPLLAVIAVAAPLMGLLGTVTGMIRTFALITVFGTGNAGKLASGISEVLISTELGLIVAIPTLVAHGFLTNRIQKKLSLLECYALEFVTAAQQRSAPPASAPAVNLPLAN
ncbi:MAG TPA: MotA/TolQ/ExbB proton channel family protein [Opitutaceae bacterium]|jgi:biopolymer transport protein ExbB|nr:MotA/TolQ/ExbB proton channel family protein [Opitutaceae bacterium]